MIRSFAKRKHIPITIYSTQKSTIKTGLESTHLTFKKFQAFGMGEA